MKMSVPEFIDSFLVSPLPVEVTMLGENSKFTYVGCETNWEAFKTHLSGFTNSIVCSVLVDDGKLLVNAYL